MSDSLPDFAALSTVNHLWPAFVERLGLDKAQRAVRQALDLQGISLFCLRKRAALLWPVLI